MLSGEVTFVIVLTCVQLPTNTQSTYPFIWLKCVDTHRKRLRPHLFLYVTRWSTKLIKIILKTSVRTSKKTTLVHYKDQLVNADYECAVESCVGGRRLANSPMKMADFWVVAPCSLVEANQRFRGPCCLYHQGDESLPRGSHWWVREVAIPRYPSYPVPGGIAGPPCLRGIEIRRPGPPGWGLGVGFTAPSRKN
jgi:hypothetical protein